MKKYHLKNQSLLIVFFLSACALPAKKSLVHSASLTDPFLWLEPTNSPRALQWVAAQNKKTLDVLTTDPHYTLLRAQIQKILEAKDKIPMPVLRGKWIYNFWQDKDHTRGVWRRTLVSDYARKSPPWETLIDVDRLAAQEKENWVWQGAECLPPQYRRCLITLSRGGKDAAVIREFSTRSRKFISDGFNAPEAKSDIHWLNKNETLAATNFGAGSLTSSGYPREVRLWKRGEPLSEAKLIFKGKKTDVGVSGSTFFRPHRSIPIINRQKNFFTNSYYVLKGSETLVKIPLPKNAEINSVFKGQILARLRSDWKTPFGNFGSGDLISLPIDKMATPHPETFARLVYHPDSRSALNQVVALNDRVYLSILYNVKGRLIVARENSSAWVLTPASLPKNGAISVEAANPFQDIAFVLYQSFLTPQAIDQINAKRPLEKPRVVKILPARFNAKNLVIDQFEATSQDGTRVPYFLIHLSGIRLDGNNPTLLYGYGGFEVSLPPFYSGIIGKSWLEKGGVYALANIRGGGEFGPAWHEAALKTHRQRAYDDFLAVARDIIQRKISSPRHLGIMGGSNGGLLVGVAFTEAPLLFHAVVCQVPLLDMMRYTKIGAGASWIAEYGDPEYPPMAQSILRYSPYQNLKSGVHYPEVFFVTSADDDRVAPAHARKMAAKMGKMGDPVLYYESLDGGHSSAANLKKAAKEYALEYTYLFKKLFNHP